MSFNFMAVTDADLTLSSWQSCGAFPRLPAEGIWEEEA